MVTYSSWIKGSGQGTKIYVTMLAVSRRQKYGKEKHACTVTRSSGSP